MADDFDINSLDDVIHGRVRLGVMAFLSAAGSAEFSKLKKQLEVTDGNLSVHLKKLEEAGYVAVEKAFVDRKPLTTLRITTQGRTAFKAYLDAISKLVG